MFEIAARELCVISFDNFILIFAYYTTASS